MSQTDNIIPFPLKAPVGTSSEPTFAHDQNESLAAVDNLIAFLQANRHLIKCFAGGFICEEIPGSNDGEAAFHIVNSPINATDYAAVLEMLAKSYAKQLNEHTSEV